MLTSIDRPAQFHNRNENHNILTYPYVIATISHNIYDLHPTQESQLWQLLLSAPHRMHRRVPRPPTTMAVGDTFNGNLSEKFDEDWIGIELEAGKTYKINLSGRGSKGDEAEDTILKLYDAGGTLRAENDDIDTANRIYDSELEFTPTTTGTYYLSASSYSANPNRDNSGAYTLTVVSTMGQPRRIQLRQIQPHRTQHPPTPLPDLTGPAPTPVRH